MKFYYFPSPIECAISTLYLNHKINGPRNICEITLGQMFNIHVFHSNFPTSYYANGSFLSLTIDSRLSNIQQREEFFSGIAMISYQKGLPENHLLSTIIHQLPMTQLIQQLALPYHMLTAYDISHPDIVSTLSYDFKLPKSLCLERIKPIQKLKEQSSIEKRCCELTRR
ncbi:hypothetical protein ACJ2A9_09735 [Anaerobacillus sp. MEB173]|uniref:hypothetical protein n=1 Tax=Anaerobacillus sp. MEB173 TaxID=3383345 RepID=UPI003F8EC00C